MMFAFSSKAQESCHPLISDIRFDGDYDPIITERLFELYEADQAIREPDAEKDIQQSIADDLARREEVLTYLQAGQITRATDLHYAALIFQHGDCPEHYQLAADLTLRAYELGNENSAWLHTAATDRYLLKIGKVQRFGTQYVTNLRGKFVMCPVDSATTDDERAEWGLPTLEKLKARTTEFDDLFDIQPHRWAIFSYIPIIGQLIDTVFVYKQCFA